MLRFKKVIFTTHASYLFMVKIRVIYIVHEQHH